MLQYIGARYVPIFYQNSLDPTSSEWEVNVTYEPLTWVSLPNGYMYISKKEVPANIGTPASNPDYWLEAGQYNAYIQSLQDQIDDMNDGSVAGSLQNQINNMQDGNISGSLQDQINDNASDINTINTVTIPALNKAIDLANRAITNRKMIFIGDSYAGSMGASSWLNTVIRILNLNSSNYGAIWKAGYGFSTSGNKFIDLVQSPTEGYPTINIDPDLITDIYVIAGSNDVGYSEATLTQDISDFITYTLGIYPNAIIHIGFNGWTDVANNHAAYTTTLNIYKNAALLLGAKWIEGPQYVLHKVTMIQADHVHPTTAGGLELGYITAQAVLNGDSAFLHYFYNDTVSWSSNISTNIGSMTVITALDNDRVNVKWDAFSFVLNLTITDSADVIIGELNSATLWPYDSFKVKIPFTVLHSYNSVITPINAYIYYKEGYVYFGMETGSPAISAGAFLIPSVNINLPTFPQVVA